MTKDYQDRTLRFHRLLPTHPTQGKIKEKFLVVDLIDIGFGAKKPAFSKPCQQPVLAAPSGPSGPILAGLGIHSAVPSESHRVPSRYGKSKPDAISFNKKSLS